MSDNGSNGSAKNSIVSRIVGFLSNKHGDEFKSNLETFLEQNEERVGNLDDSEKILISNVLQAGEKLIKSIIIPRSKISVVDIDMPIEEIVTKVINSPYTEYPVYKKNMDNIVGYINIKDVIKLHFSEDKNKSINDILKNIMFVSPSMCIIDCFSKLRLEKKHLAIVVDEFGGVEGMITIKNVIEEIVGEIDFYNEEYEEHAHVEEGSSIISGSMSIEDFEEKFSVKILKDSLGEDIETMGGLVTHIAGRVPDFGEIIEHKETGVEFRVVDCNPRKVIKLEIISETI